MNNFIKKIAFILLGSNLRARYRIKKIGDKKVLTILNLHRVCRDDGSSYKPLDPAIFEELLRFLVKNFSLLTFGNLIESSLTSESSKPLLIISFDDGYKDFIDVAVPILFKHKIKVNQNLIPECVDSGEPPLNVLIQDFIGKASDSELRKINIPGFVIGQKLEKRVQIGLRVSKYIKNKPISEQKIIKEKILESAGNLTSFKSTPMMNIDDVKELAGLHEFGAHSYSHASMEFETDSYVLDDLIKCKEWFNVNLSQNVDIYAFPNGSFKKNHIQLAKDCGYKHILLVNDLFSSSEMEVHYRFGFYAENNFEMKFRALGCFSEIQYKDTFDSLLAAHKA